MSLIRIFQKHGVKLFVIFALLGGVAYLFAADAKYKGYAPDQPIPFSHKIHAGELQVNCQFCHAGVEVSAHATVPDMATCMKCHATVASDSPNIQFLRQSFKQGTPVRWRKVYDLPDHVRFSHKPHVARGFTCQQCHGEVQTMDKVSVQSNFNMGWCVDCHRQNSLHLTPPGNNHTVKLTECGTCHY